MTTLCRADLGSLTTAAHELDRIICSKRARPCDSPRLGALNSPASDIGAGAFLRTASRGPVIHTPRDVAPLTGFATEPPSVPVSGDLLESLIWKR